MTQHNYPPIAELGAETTDTDGIPQYTHSDMVLRIAAKELMMEQDTDLMPHRRADVERHISHVVFELAYRTHTMDEYIEMHREAVLLDGGGHGSEASDANTQVA